MGCVDTDSSEDDGAQSGSKDEDFESENDGEATRKQKAMRRQIECKIS